MQTMTMEQAVQEYIIGVHALELYNNFVKERMGAHLDEFSENLQQTTAQATIEYKKNPPDLVKIAELLAQYIEYMEEHNQRAKVRSEVIARYIEIISDKWLSFFLAENFYIPTNKSFFLEQLSTMVSQCYSSSNRKLSRNIIANIDSFQEMSDNMPFTPTQKEKIADLQNTYRKLAMYINFFDSSYLNISLLIHKYGEKNMLNTDQSFSKLLNQIDNSDKYPQKTRLKAIDSDSDFTIWRYMPIHKLLSILFTKTLFIPSATCLKETTNDPNEGKHVTLASLKQTDLPTKIPNALRAIEELENEIAEITFVSSWYIGDQESLRMWDTFGSGDNYGVAVRTTYKKLIKSIENPEFPILSAIVDYNTDSSTGLESLDSITPFIYKNQEFDYESELRLIMVNIPNASDKKPGITVNLSLENFIDEIVLSPATPQWIMDTYSKMVESLGLIVKLSYSSLRVAPE